MSGEVERFEIPNLHALNFLLHGALDGGGTRSLMNDAQGKVFSTSLLRMHIEVPEAVAEASSGELDPPIAASRVGAEYGLHTLFLDSEDDLVEISHRARSRRGFATGAVLAAERLEGKKGFFSFPELLGLNQQQEVS